MARIALWTLAHMAAVTIGRSDTALGALYRRLSARLGNQKAVTATARKMVVLFYNAVRHGMTYHDQGAAAYDERHRQRVLSNLQQRAKTLGCALAPIPEAAAVSWEVSEVRWNQPSKVLPKSRT